MGRLKSSRLKVLVDNKIPLAVCSQFEDRYAGYDVIARDEFIAFPRMYTSVVEHPLKTKDPDYKDIMIIPFGKEDEIYFNNNLDKFKKAYEAKGKKVFETVYESLKEHHSAKRKIRQEKRR